MTGHDEVLVKQWVGWVLLALSLVVTYQGWRNSKPTVLTETMSSKVACEKRADCKVEAVGPQKVSTDFLSRTYEWRTTKGPVEVRCQRAFIFFGAWDCRAKS